MAIHINPAHKGKFHQDVGKAPGSPITESDIQKGKNSQDPAVRKRATFAENARHWHHGGPKRRIKNVGKGK